MAKIAKFLGANIKRYRHLRGLTQQELADQAKVTKETIGNLEIGRKWVTTQTLHKIVQVLQIEELQLFEDPTTNGWDKYKDKLTQLLARMPFDVFEGLCETKDWTEIRRAIKSDQRIQPKL